MSIRCLSSILPSLGMALGILACETAGTSSTAAAPKRVTRIPSFTLQPVSQTVAVGQTATFRVIAAGAEPLAIQWFRDGEAIVGATAPSFTTQPALAGDNGATFVARVSTALGGATSVPARLKVVPSGMPGHLFLAGNLNPTTPVSWQDGVPSALPLPTGSTQGLALALGVSGPNTYIGGSVNNDRGGSTPGYWLNGIWVGLGIPTPWVNGQVEALVLAGDHVYAGGYVSAMPYTTEIGVPGFWQNGAWEKLPLPGSATGGAVTCLALAGSDVIAGGYISENKGFSPGYWLNGRWIGLPMPVTVVNAYVTDLKMSGTTLHAVGYGFTASSNLHVPACWTNGALAQLQMPAGASEAMVQAIAVDGTDVYLAGAVGAGETAPLGAHGAFPGYWLNGTWFALPLPPGPTAGVACALGVAETGVHAAGCFSRGVVVTSADLEVPVEDLVPGYWRNGAWVKLPLPSGLRAPTATGETCGIKSLVVN